MAHHGFLAQPNGDSSQKGEKSRKEWKTDLVLVFTANAGNLPEMKKAIHANLCHCASNRGRPLHDQCPTGTSS